MKYSQLIFITCCLFQLSGNSGYAQESAFWLTAGDESRLLARQQSLKFGDQKKAQLPEIKVDAAQQYQQIDGFGFALTGGSAQHIIAMSAPARQKLLQELFGTGDGEIGISYLRVSIGASDLNDHVFSYDDLRPGETDPKLSKFDLGQDKKDVIPVLKEILRINPAIKIMGSPWSAPVWMKTNNNIQGGKLKEMYYPAYAQYFVKYIRAMKKEGIAIDAITIQNEPFNDGNTPSMQMFAKEQAAFIKNHLGPAFKSAGIPTKIILYDHNCDAPEYPISILADPKANAYIDGSGFHLYAGKTSAMTKVHQAFPDKHLYFTEMMVINRNGLNIAGPVDRILIGAIRNWSRNVILWNLAANARNEPHTDNGGCTMCQGAVTIEGDQVGRNSAYYVIAHAAKFVPDGSVRIESSQEAELSSVAFKTPAGKIVLLLVNKGKQEKDFQISFNGKYLPASLPAGSVATYVWQ